MSNLTELIDINSLDYCGDVRQNPKGNNLVFAGTYPTLEKFEQIKFNDRAGRDSSILNVKAVNNWELWSADNSCAEITGGHTRSINALKFLDGVSGATNAIQSVSDSWMAVGLTQLVHGKGENGISLKDGGDQDILFIGDTTKASSYLQVEYKKNLPDVGDTIKFRKDFFTEYQQTNYLEDITYSASNDDYTYSTTELKQGYHYTIKVTGKATRDDGTIVDGNFQIPQGDVSKKNVISFGISNSQGIPISDHGATYINGGEYTKSFTATKNAKIGFRLEDFDRTNTIGSFTIKLYESVQQPIKSGVVKSANNVHILKPFNKEGQSSEEYVIQTINEVSNEFTLKRSDRESVAYPAVTTHITSPTLGKWWQAEHDCSLSISGKSDDDTAFSATINLEEGNDSQSLDLIAIVANIDGLSVSYNGYNPYNSDGWYLATSKPCYSLSTKAITIGDGASTSLVNSASVKKDRFVRHFEWMFFDQDLISSNYKTRIFSEDDSILRVLSYLRCKYGFPWLNGLEHIGEWKKCIMQAPPLDVPNIEPPIATCCFTQVTWTFFSHTYVSLYETTATAPNTRHFQTSGNVQGTASEQVQYTNESGNSSTSCRPLQDTTLAWGVTGDTQSAYTWNMYGPFLIPTSSAVVFPIPCVPPVDRGNNLLKNKARKLLEGLKTTTYTTSVEAQGAHKVTRSYWSKPNRTEINASDVGKYALYGNSTTGRITGISIGAVTTYGLTNLYAKNDVITEGSESTTGSTTTTQINGWAYISCKPKTFGGSWTYIQPIRDVFDYTLMADATYSSKTTLQSSSTISSEYPTFQSWIKFSDRGNFPLIENIDEPPYTRVLVSAKPDEMVSIVRINETATPATYRVFLSDSIVNTFSTTALTQTKDTSQYFGDFYTTATSSTREVAFKGGETEFYTFGSKIFETSAWTLIKTFTDTTEGTFSTSMEALSYEGLDEDQAKVNHYALCGDKEDLKGLSFLAQYKLTGNRDFYDEGRIYSYFATDGKKYITMKSGESGELYFDREIDGIRNVSLRMLGVNTYGDNPMEAFREVELIARSLEGGEMVAVTSGVEYEKAERIREARRQEARKHREFNSMTEKNKHSYYVPQEGFYGEVRRGTETSSSRPAQTRITTFYKNSPDSTFTKWGTYAVSSTWKNIGGNTDLLVKDKRVSAFLAPYNRTPVGDLNKSELFVDVYNADYRKNFPHSISSNLPKQTYPNGPATIVTNPNEANMHLRQSNNYNSWYEINTWSATARNYAQGNCA